MKTLREFCCFVAFILLLASCKKYSIEPADSVPMYKDEISVTNYDPGNIDNFLEQCFFSLNGYTADPIDVREGNQSYGQFIVNIKSANIDFGISGGNITTPGGSSNIFYDPSTATGPSTWALAHNGFFSAATISKASFDTLTHIEAIKNLTAKCSDNGFSYVAGSLFFFNVDRGYGIGYVKSVDQWGDATFDLKYTIINP